MIVHLYQYLPNTLIFYQPEYHKIQRCSEQIGSLKLSKCDHNPRYKTTKLYVQVFLIERYLTFEQLLTYRIHFVLSEECY